ncbi:hypothetical protein P152DRAFT_218980 [Eremomyces bilateralis CBS 781.70]|uniref:Uncharacterized protein n=1 Tax=Eremomyces bilateralis CBS 781.70 TaxID=1392243 RepID=A0A6G1FS32_9PEZI|nr:uncharacterized protein P152DRAFT_218980 [Eremomyces bilateralis CBS 781.70]KAF1808501.1 hypothetical protein P152DRAFT_218980 [Eremomyces bilateralis CBS 781.70]
MPPAKKKDSSKQTKSGRTSEENQERAYIAASRRSDRSFEARWESAQRASEIHKKRTGRGFKLSHEIVMNEEIYEEEDDFEARFLSRVGVPAPKDFSLTERLAAYHAAGVPAERLSGFDQPLELLGFAPQQTRHTLPQGNMATPNQRTGEARNHPYPVTMGQRRTLRNRRASVVPSTGHSMADEDALSPNLRDSLERRSSVVGSQDRNQRYATQSPNMWQSPIGSGHRDQMRRLAEQTFPQRTDPTFQFNSEMKTLPPKSGPLTPTARDPDFPLGYGPWSSYTSFYTDNPMGSVDADTPSCLRSDGNPMSPPVFSANELASPHLHAQEPFFGNRGNVAGGGSNDDPVFLDPCFGMDGIDQFNETLSLGYPVMESPACQNDDYSGNLYGIPKEQGFTPLQASWFPIDPSKSFDSFQDETRETDLGLDSEWLNLINSSNEIDAAPGA